MGLLAANASPFAAASQRHGGRAKQPSFQVQRTLKVRRTDFPLNGAWHLPSVRS